MADTNHHNLIWGVRRSVRYHRKRQAFFESLDRWTSFCLLLLGSGSVALILHENDGWAMVAGVLVAVFSSLKLVFAYSRKAARHGRFASDFTRIEKKQIADESDQAVKEATGLRLELEANEPPILRVLDILCHNELIRAMGIDNPGEKVPVLWYQRLLANWFDVREHMLAKGSRAG